MRADIWVKSLVVVAVPAAVFTVTEIAYSLIGVTLTTIEQVPLFSAHIVSAILNWAGLSSSVIVQLPIDCLEEDRIYVMVEG